MATSVASDFVHLKCQFKNIRSNKKELKEIVSAICALLNSNGGQLELVNDNEGIAGKCSFKVHIRTIEQTIRTITGIELTVLNINAHFKEEKGSIFILVKKADSVITIGSNLYLPSQTEVVPIPGLAINSLTNIINRKHLPQAVQVESGQKIFAVKNRHCGFQESSTIQFKCLKSGPSKRTTLADRITGKRNKFICYVSAFANHKGGHIYYGINDDGVVEGQYIPSEDDKTDLTKKVEKAINKMIWPEFTGGPKRGKHWEIFFEPVIDENSTPIPSNFVIVIFIAPCLGGVFTEVPECYRMVEGKVEKMPFAAWKNRVRQPVLLCGNEEIPNSVRRIMWSSTHNRNAFISADQSLMQLIANGNWDGILKQGECLINDNNYPQPTQVKLLVLSKRITAYYRTGDFNEAQALLQEYANILPFLTQDQFIFEALRLYSNAALKRASEDESGLKNFLIAALSKAELIEPGLVTAIIYVLAATVADRLRSEDQTENLSPEYLSRKALHDVERIIDSSNFLLADMKHKSYLTLAAFYLGCNISGQRTKEYKEVRLTDANNCIMAVYQSISQGNAQSNYMDVQLNLVHSMYNYRKSQKAPDQRALYLGDAFSYAKKAETLATNYRFTELIKWSQTHKALCME